MKPFFSEVASSIPFDNSTNGFAATDVQAAIEEAQRPVITEVTDTANATTTSGTDALLTTMTITPTIAGNYMVCFESSITSNAAGAAITYSVYVNGTQQAATVKKMSPLDGGTLSVGSARADASLRKKIAWTTGTIEIRWSTSGGTATCGPRTMDIMRCT